MWPRPAYLVLFLVLLSPPRPTWGNQPPQPPRADLHGDPLPEKAVARLGTVRFRQGFLSQAVAFTPRGDRLASGGRIGFGVCLWDVATGKPVYRLQIPYYVASLAFSPDGKLLLTGTTLSVLDAATGKELRRLDAPPGNFEYVAFSPDGRTVAASENEPGAVNGVVILYDVTAGKELRRLTGRGGVGGPVTFSPDGKQVASEGEDHTIRFWDAATGKELRHLRGHQKLLTSLAFAPGGKVLASAAEDGVLRLWAADTGKPLPLEQAKWRYYHVAFSPDGNLLAGTGDGVVRLWEAATGKEVRHWETDDAGPVAFAPDGKLLATTGRSCVRLWEVATGKEIAGPAAHTQPVVALRWAADGRTLYSAGMDRKVLEWDPATGRERGRLCREPLGQGKAIWGIRGVALAPDGKVVAEVGYSLMENLDDPVIRLWDTVTGKPLHALRGHKKVVYLLRFSPDGQVLASSGVDGIRLWDVATGKERHHLPGHRTPGPDFAFSPNGKQLVSIGADQTLRLWEVATGKELRCWAINQQTILLVFSPDGRSVAAMSNDGVHVWSVADGKELLRIAQRERVFALAFSPSGRTLAATRLIQRRHPNGDRVFHAPVYLWEVYSGQEIGQIDTGQGIAYHLAFAPDGRTLATGGADANVLLWDLAGGAAPGAAKLTATDLTALWADLAADAAKAEPALWALVRAPAQSVPFLRERLRPAPPQKVAALVADLDHKTLAVRQKASVALDEMGEAAEAALRNALADGLPLEQRRRVEQILAKRDRDAITKLRAMEALEYVGTPEARAVLEEVAKGTPNPRVAQVAAAALERLASRKSLGKP
jgi:WD40 repeat protein